MSFDRWDPKNIRTNKYSEDSRDNQCRGMHFGLTLEVFC
jgi:hypothetical protein